MTVKRMFLALFVPVVLVALVAGCPAPRSPADDGAGDAASEKNSLAAAAAAGDAAKVAELLAAGADPTARGADGKTALDHAIAHPEHAGGNLAVLTALAGALRKLDDPHPDRRPMVTEDGTPMIDLNQVRVKLLWYDPDTLRPTEDPANGITILKIGTKVYPDSAGGPDWELLEQDLVGFRDGYRGGAASGLPVIVDVRPQVPDALAGRALAAVARAKVVDVRFAGPRDAPRVVKQDEKTEVIEKPIIILEDEVEEGGD